MTFHATFLLILIGLASVAGCAFTSEAGPAPLRPSPLKHYDPLP
jgi:hypothetical protein